MTDPTRQTDSHYRRVARPLWFAAGTLSLIVGLIGVVLPLLPTTVFILLAAFAYGKSSPRMTHYLETHRFFGPIIADWRAYGAIAPGAKAIAVTMMATVLVVSVVMGLSATVVAIQAVCIAAAATYVLSRPSGPSKEPAGRERGEEFSQSSTNGGAN